MLDRLKTALNTLFDKDAQMLLQGPLPLWMQQAFEEEAARLGKPVGAVIFHTLRREAIRLLDERSK